MKIKASIKIIIHIIFIVVLTISTQIGGIIYLMILLIISKKKPKYKIKRVFFFTLLYLISTYLIIPNIAPLFGRVKIEDNYRIGAHSFITKVCNRNYVTPKMHAVLTDVSLRINKEFPEIKLIYLDANFPFFDGFPLLPHLSHKDGKKVDISFIYENEKGKTNLKPSLSGYGIFEAPLRDELNQTQICKQNGFWQYDFTKYLTLGFHHRNLKFSTNGNKKIIENILANSNVSKVFIEPHLKNRLNLNHSKIRFHGCRAVRHDDHIHFQIH
jgi:energy-coupling factor transporter transmembrane protein EcfT